ncbi:hypothetical protein TRIUR3_00202 [Triticum urartu]|uniref:Uncharacterized protein n=1 Tax=Triticum urartu TaxID=4572 RepID=M8A382_TRIUA|nr:hypothetical protein TRIUR3_00202 [Triticum urartu]
MLRLRHYSIEVQGLQKCPNNHNMNHEYKRSEMSVRSSPPDDKVPGLNDNKRLKDVAELSRVIREGLNKGKTCEDDRVDESDSIEVKDLGHSSMGGYLLFLCNLLLHPSADPAFFLLLPRKVIVKHYAPRQQHQKKLCKNDFFTI